MNASNENDGPGQVEAWRGLCDRVRALEARPYRRGDRLFVVGALLGALLAAAGVASGQSAGEAIFIDAMGRLGIGTRTPKAQLDLQQQPRTGVASKIDTNTASLIYATGALGPESGIEFRKSDESEGIGFGFNTIYATGSQQSQSLNLKPRGTGNVVVQQGAIVGMGTVPPGAILMWSGDPAKLPGGWQLCDGANGTPDMRARFIVGYDPREMDYRQMNSIGGQERVILTPAEMGNHTHDVTFAGDYAARTEAPPPIAPNTDRSSVGLPALVYPPPRYNAPGKVPVYFSVTDGTKITTRPASHENRPPYLVLAYVMYAGPGK